MSHRTPTEVGETSALITQSSACEVRLITSPSLFWMVIQLLRIEGGGGEVGKVGVKEEGLFYSELPVGLASSISHTPTAFCNASG